MTDKKAAKIPAKKTAKLSPVGRDGGEDVALLEPMRISEEHSARGQLNELVLELTRKSASFRASLPNGLAEPLADYVRSMNCYYSNLIEGHDTHPVDIEKALNNDLSDNPAKRDMQLEAKAHIEVQRWIDEGGLTGREGTIAAVLEVHRRFTGLLPPDMRWVENPESGEKIPVEPGVMRTRDARVGAHIAISPGALGRFMQRYEERYANLGRFDAILAAGPAHHRLLYIHPFADGNGRVTRLISYAMLLRALESGGLWSIARGLARRANEYKAHLASCDRVRQGDRDGRGNLSEAALVAFTRFFLSTCIDQVDFMSALMEPKRLRHRILAWADEEIRFGRLPERSTRVLDAILFRGTLPRAEVPSAIGQSVRSGTNATNALAKAGIISAAGARADWQLSFPAKLAARITPGLFPE